MCAPNVIAIYAIFAETFYKCQPHGGAKGKELRDHCNLSLQFNVKCYLFLV